MARRYELGMSLNYVSSWGICEAVREIFQNALDEEIQNPKNKWYFAYDAENKILRIGNKFSKLPISSLLLGYSSKSDDNRTIGTHGEGYKVATIVLLRNGYGLKVYNYNDKEIWTAKTIKSRRYKSEIGVFDIETGNIFRPIKGYDLIFEISNITEDDIIAIKNKILWVNDTVGETISSSEGRVLLDERYKGKVFVKGLYVCDNGNLNYGYDINPDLIKLDRDRGLIDSFDLQYTLGKLIVGTKNVDFINKVKELWDGYYIRVHATNYSNLEPVYEDSYMKFIKEYGDNAVPCNSTHEFNTLKKLGMNAVMVTESTKYYVTHCSRYNPSANCSSDLNALIMEKLNKWYAESRKYLPKSLVSEGEDIISLIESTLI